MSMDSGPIVLTTDFSEGARRAYGPAAELAAAMGADIVLLHVHKSLTDPNDTSDYAEELKLDEGKLEEERSFLPESTTVRPQAIAATQVPQAVAQYADTLGARCIVVSTHGRAGLRHLILGSDAEGIVRLAHVPVVTVPPEAPE